MAEKIRYFSEIWGRGRDSNPRYGYPYAAFRVRCIQPLCHLSGRARRAGVFSQGSARGEGPLTRLTPSALGTLSRKGRGKAVVGRQLSVEPAQRRAQAQKRTVGDYWIPALAPRA